jgi:hypothetical protein
MTSKAQPNGGLFATLRHFLTAFEESMCKLNRIQFSAPWQSENKRGC